MALGPPVVSPDLTLKQNYIYSIIKNVYKFDV